MIALGGLHGFWFVVAWLTWPALSTRWPRGFSANAVQRTYSLGEGSR